MHTSHRNSGIDAVGSIPWGSHFCQFYRNEADLAETLVPFFQAGLDANESCLWVTSQSLDAGKATSLMARAIPDFDRYVSSGQMEIVSISDWYKAGDVFDPDVVLNGWIEREQRSRERGFAGLRLTGDTIWVERSGWDDFMDYERKVNGAFRRHNLVALCTYCVETCSAEDVIDVCRHHQFALTRRDGDWELLESSSLKIAKEELMRLNMELEHRVESRTAALNTAVRARDEFLAMLGHELRNPLAPIRTAAEVIGSLAPAGSPIAASSAILDRQVGHLTRLVDDLLDVARITQGHIQLNMKETSLADIIDMAVEQARPLIDQRGHSLAVALPGRAVRVNADATRLAQVFGNLLHNAAKYTPNGGEVGIATRILGNMATITVTDTGAGIPSGMLDAVFGLFTQLPRSLDRSDGGLGIGLTLARRIVELHGGTIAAHSDGPDQGSSFTVQLGLVEPTRTSAPSLPAPDRAAAGTSGRRILLVDDNADARELMATLLSLHGHDVTTAEDGEGALAAAQRCDPEVVMLDIGLPGIDGYEVARRLRAMPATACAMLIALTGYGQPSDLQAATAAGFDDHILKPAKLEDVLAKVAAPR
ncbi:MEDS domain-containing protein [Pseudoduganella plicata]|nr:MEDS domain-containing protein [Pseudoduganella plicata]QBQ36166.1 response regulator [Pseudoduganella plicata]